MLHIGFTITGRFAHITIKNEAKEIIHQERLDMGESRGINAEWLACKAAIRQAGALNRGAIRLYSDCSVIEQLARLDVPHELPKDTKFPTGFGKLPQYDNQEIFHFYDAVGMLWGLFGGKWEAYQVSQDRILKGEAA